MKTRIVSRKPKKILAALRKSIVGENIKVVGILGTVGKTIAAHVLWELLRKNNIKVGMLSSLGLYDQDGEIDGGMSANDVQESQLIDLVNDAAENGFEMFILEVTTKNIKSGVFDRFRFDAGILTNILHHDKDLYSDWNEYAELKLQSINLIKDEGLLVTEASEELINWLQSQEEKIDGNIYLYMTGKHDYSSYKTKDGFDVQINNENYNFATDFEFNIQNAIKAIKLAQYYLKHKDSFAEEIKNFKFPKGRAELLRHNEVQVIIDAAKRKEEVEYSLTEIRRRLEGEQKIISIIGAEGGIDPDRKKIGLGVVHLVDIIIVCPTDPRKESTVDINNAILKHLEAEQVAVVDRFSSEDEYKLTNKESLKIRLQRVVKNGDIPVLVFDEDSYTARLNAIELALKLAEPGDLVYISGKGSETSMHFKGVEYEWSDHEALKLVSEQ